MKKTIISIIVSLAVITTAAAQTNYYPKTEDTISKSGYAYGYRSEKTGGVVHKSRLEIFNMDNRYLDVEWRRKDGSKPSYEDQFATDEFPHSSTSTMTGDQFSSLINNCLSAQQKALLKGSFIDVICRVDTSTGKVADVYFSFFRLQPARYIPVETYRSIELAIKQKLSFTMTAEGQRMNYMEILWKQMF